MKLFEFIPNTTGLNAFYVASETIEMAVDSLKTLKEEYSCPEDYFENKERYTIITHDPNEPTWLPCD